MLKTKKYRLEKSNSRGGYEVYYPKGNLIRGIIEIGASIPATVWKYDNNENFIESEFIGKFKNKFAAAEAIINWHKANII